MLNDKKPIVRTQAVTYPARGPTLNKKTTFNNTLEDWNYKKIRNKSPSKRHVSRLRSTIISKHISDSCFSQKNNPKSMVKDTYHTHKETNENKKFKNYFYIYIPKLR